MPSDDIAACAGIVAKGDPDRFRAAMAAPVALRARLPFSFTALLGLLSLSGMLMKNAIVLLEEIDMRIAEAGVEGDRLTSLVDASVGRLRPVFLAAATTILGMIPLLSDAFFASMSVTIMGGLAFATVLAMFSVPVLYAVFFGLGPQRARAKPKAGSYRQTL